MTRDQAVEMVVKAFPHSSHIKQWDTTRDGEIWFTWRGDRFKLTIETLMVQHQTGDFLAIDNLAILAETAIQNAFVRGDFAGAQTPRRRSRMQRDKGKRGEREIVAFAEGVGLKAKRTWQTASGEDRNARFCDIEIEGRAYQVKFYAEGFATVYAALQGVKGAFFRRNQDKWLAVVPAEDYLRLLAAAKQTKEGA